MSYSNLNLGGTQTLEPGTNLFPARQLASVTADRSRSWRIQTGYLEDASSFLSGNGALLIEANNGINGSWTRTVDWGQSVRVEAKGLTASFTANKQQYEADPGGKTILAALGIPPLTISAYLSEIVAGAPDSALLTWDSEPCPVPGTTVPRQIPPGAVEWRLFHVQASIAGSSIDFLDVAGAIVATWTNNVNMDFEWRPVPWAWNPASGAVTQVQARNTGAVPLNIGFQWRIAL